MTRGRHFGVQELRRGGERRLEALPCLRNIETGFTAAASIIGLTVLAFFGPIATLFPKAWNGSAVENGWHRIRGYRALVI
jgi:hypothetical protein